MKINFKKISAIISLVITILEVVVDHFNDDQDSPKNV